MNKLILIAILAFPLSLSAQQKVEMGVFGGFGNYQGDLAEDPVELSETKLTYGAFVRYHLKDKIKLRGNFYYGFISGDDANASSSLKDRGWSFESSLLEVTLVGEYHPLGKSRVGDSGLFRKQISPYVAAGLGMATFSPVVKTRLAADASKFPEQGEKTLSVSLPVIVGVRADLHENFSLGLEWGWRVTFSDYLDGVSKNGNSDKNDLYLFAGLSASFFFGDSQEFDFGK